MSGVAAKASDIDMDSRTLFSVSFFVLLVGFLAGAPVFGQGATPAKTAVSGLPPMPPPMPQINFRELLAMTPAEREKILVTRSEQQRQVLVEKLREYESLSPVEREARLCSVQLRAYLRPLLTTPAGN